MKWSQLKKRIESTFADAVAGRVEVWNTHYRKSDDQKGEAWITIDKQRVSSMGDDAYDVEVFREACRLCDAPQRTTFLDLAKHDGYQRAYEEAGRIVHDRGVVCPWEFNRALFNYLSLSIDEAIKSPNPIIRAFATLDRRFGKRRLTEFSDSEEPPLVRVFYRFRCEAEGIKIEPGHAGPLHP